VANEEFYNFEEALDQLRLKEEELKRLVSEGEIRAFREGETMRLRRADVENLKRELGGGEVVDLDGVGEELVFEDDAVFEEAGMATEEISEMDTLLDEDVDDVDDVEELEIEEESAAAVRRPAAAAIKPVDEAPENLLFRSLAVVTSLILLLAFPLTISLSSGSVSEIAKSIAGMFGQFG
jgi:excisionase family DNA binding protein